MLCGHVLSHADERGVGGLRRGGIEDNMGIEGRRESDWEVEDGGLNHGRLAPNPPQDSSLSGAAGVTLSLLRWMLLIS